MSESSLTKFGVCTAMLRLSKDEKVPLGPIYYLLPSSVASFPSFSIFSSQYHTQIPSIQINSYSLELHIRLYCLMLLTLPDELWIPVKGPFLLGNSVENCSPPGDRETVGYSWGICAQSAGSEWWRLETVSPHPGSLVLLAVVAPKKCIIALTIVNYLCNRIGENFERLFFSAVGPKRVKSVL